MSQYCDSYCDVYNSDVVKARKEHTCSACRTTIQKGEHYARIFALHDGYVHHYKRCGACEVTHRHLAELCAASGDDLYPDEELNCGLSYKNEWGGDPPDEIARLPFLSSAERGRLLREETEKP